MFHDGVVLVEDVVHSDFLLREGQCSTAHSLLELQFLMSSDSQEIVVTKNHSDFFRLLFIAVEYLHISHAFTTLELSLEVLLVQLYQVEHI